MRSMEELVHIHLGDAELEGNLELPTSPQGVVLFAHGSGSSRRSPRNRFVANRLKGSNLGTLLVDLLTAEEDQDPARRFDIGFLTDRLVQITQWLAKRLAGTGLRIGYFGASTGAAAALRAAADLGGVVAAVVSRGGRPDLADDILPEVEAPTMLIVGGNDEPVTTWNIASYQKLRAKKELVVMPGATHLFEEPGALEEVARLAADWFGRFLASSPSSRRSP